MYPPLWLACSVWGIGAVFYLVGFYQRVAPAVITTELMAGFGIGAAALGHLSAFYYYPYLAMQIPTGILVDRWGPRNILAGGAVIAALGTLIFAQAESIMAANLGRAIIGGSVAVAWVALLKLASHWFALRRFAMISGWALLIGVLGAVTAGAPLRLLVERFSWRPVFLAVAVLTLIVGAAIWLFVRDDPSARGYLSYAPATPPPDRTRERARPSFGLGRVLGYRNTWLLTLAPAGLAGPILTFAGLWGVPFLWVRFNLPPAQGAMICSALLVSMAVGAPILGGLSDRMGRRKPIYLIGCVVAALGWTVIIFVPELPLEVFVALVILTGLASGVVVIGFAFGRESVPPYLAGTVAGTINMGVMAGATILQPAIGWVLDLMWTGQTFSGARVYSLAAFQVGFGLMLAWSILACFLIALTQETYCRQSN
ncbi:MAG: MFS transporter [Deltaproteobacteria bacterium]|nr:MFS transporter [Deltaproteobacteria bacterium]